ncbi:MAG: lytic transglycosylase domain-containing protein [Prevotella sp.]|nr:lytic transglycosylase domain-containing protein [Prevotella sp.]MBR0265439.1 lytic transglycosylase domain-containing protein [Prevotella sp.]
MALAMVSLSALAAGNATKSNKTSGFNWNPVMDAIIQVESGGNARAVSGNSVGAMQITPILVKDCNIILKKRNSKLRYTLADRYSLEKSKEMFLLIQSFHNPENNVEKAIRAWNGGPKYSVRATNRYYKKVMNKLK